MTKEATTETDTAVPAGALDGTRVLSFGGALAGGECPALLGDLGAEVVKVESLKRAQGGRMELWRDHPPVLEPSGVAVSSGVGVLGRNQFNISIDMSTTAGRELALDLIGAADVLIENFSVGVMERWGLTPDSISERFPRLVYLSMPAYGWDGPYSDYVAFGGNMSSYVGLTEMWGVSQGTHNDYIAAVHGVYAIMAGLHLREKTGSGICIELPQTEAGAAVLGPFLINGQDGEGLSVPQSVGGSLFHGVFPCRNPNSWVALDIGRPADWDALAEVIGVGVTPPASMGDSDRPAAVEAAESVIASWTSQRTQHQAMLALQSVGIRAGAVQNGEDLFRDPQLRDREYIVEVDHPDLGPYSYPSNPFRLSKTPGRYSKRASRVGEDNARVLQSWIDLGPDEVDLLEQNGAF